MPDVGEKVPDRQGTSSSFVLSSLSVPDYPAPEPACATCPAAVWYLTTKGPQCRCEAHGFVSWVSNVNPVLACDTRERLLNEAESPDARYTGSWVLGLLSQEDYPDPRPACASCPAAVWYLTVKGPRCLCDAHRFVSWVSNVDPVLACDTRKRRLNEAESPDARYTGSWVLALLSQEDYPAPRPACASCPAAVWYLTVKGLRCLCDQHHFISWVSNREPVLACDTRERLSYENAVPDDDAPIDYGD